MAISFGIIGAMDAEIKEYLVYAKNVKEHKWHDFIFYQIELFGSKIILVKSGIGKVFSTLVCQKLIDEYNPKSIIFTGVAGALNKDLDIGDVVVSIDCLHHDLDASSLGFDRGQVPYTDYKEFKADEKLLKLALATSLSGHQVVAGRILTGDQFMTRKNINDHSYLIEDLNGHAIEMEGAAVAQTCIVNQIPFLVIRTISDKANGEAVADFNKFLPIIAKNSFVIVKNILENY